jgi:UDPglucose 6-dehydrogenase
MQIAIIGSGYVGLVVGACFADAGHTVYCADQDQKKIEDLKRGEIPIYEPGLETLVKQGVAHRRLFFTQSTQEAVAQAEVVFLAVGTPALPSGEPNMSYLKAAAEEVATSLKGYCLIVNKSTVPIGCHEWVAEWMKPKAPHPFDVVSNPEFLKEGSAVDDFLKPERVVIGTRVQSVYEKMAELYAPFVRQGNPILWMDPVSAEMTKYACNSFLATRISFMNELSWLCDRVGGDIEQVRKGMVTDSRIGKHFLYAGVGYGGSCFPKDVQGLLSTARRYELPLSIVQATDVANDRQKGYLFDRMHQHFKGELKGRLFGLWGLAFKPNTDDMREAPSLTLINQLLRAGARVQVYDPIARETAREVLQDTVRFCSSADEAAQDVDALCLLTEWNEFKNPHFEQLKSRMKQPVVFDGRNVFDPDSMQARGFMYYGVGRRPSKSF